MTSNQPPTFTLFPNVKPTPPVDPRRAHQANQPFAAKSTPKEPPSQQPRSNHHVDARPKHEVNILARRSDDRFSWGTLEKPIAHHGTHAGPHTDDSKEPSESRGDRIRGHVRKLSERIVQKLSSSSQGRPRAATDASSRSAKILKALGRN